MVLVMLSSFYALLRSWAADVTLCSWVGRAAAGLVADCKAILECPKVRRAFKDQRPQSEPAAMLGAPEWWITSQLSFALQS